MGGSPSPQATAAIKAAAKAIAERTRRVSFVCVNVGPRYGMEYVSILRDMVLRNCSTMEHDCAWWCITDRPDELPEGVYPIPADPALPGWWQKLRLFAPDMPWPEGERIVYFDLDVAITGRLEDVVERKGIIRDWHWPCLNSSVMIWDAGEHSAIWDAYVANPELIDAPPTQKLARLLPKGQVNGGDQELLTVLHDRGEDTWETFPADWFRSYRDSKGWPANDCRAVILHGDPKPHEIADGWVPNVWKIGGFTSVPQFRGVNTTEDARLANVRSSVLRDLPWFTGFKDEGNVCVIVGGAPSMKNHLADIRAHARRGGRIVSVNNSWRTLVAAGITPHVHVMLDARAENAEFVQGAPKSIRFLLAGQCHPDVFDALAEHEVVLWHNGYNDNEKLLEILKPWWDTRPVILVPGGSTVGLRALWLATYSGFRTIHMYGVDSSYAADGSHHAYAQALNDGESVLDVVMDGKRYVCAPWMLRQASEFQETWKDLREHVDYFQSPPAPSPVTIHVHGQGLIPDIARALRAQEREAAA